VTLKPPLDPNEPEYTRAEFRGGIWISEDGDDPLPTLDTDLTTPESAQFLVSRYCAVDRLVSPDPGIYKWGVFAYQVNTGTAPVTALAGRARGHSVYTISSSGRAYGVDSQIHGVEITTGVFESTATATRTNGSPTLTGITPDEEGMRFEATMPITGTGIPGATTILSVEGDAGAPDSITLSANATSTGSGTVTCSPVNPEQIGLLITANGEGDDTSAAIQVQAYDTDASYARVLNVSASGIRSDGRVIRFASATAERGISMESCTLTNGIVFSSGNYSGSGISFSSLTTPIGINFASSNTFSTSAVHFAGQNISADTTTGMKILTNSTQKLGFYGSTPVVRPSVNAAATDAATTQSLANSLRSALINLGLAA
jgi:hypothetical protein